MNKKIKNSKIPEQDLKFLMDLNANEVSEFLTPIIIRKNKTDYEFLENLEDDLFELALNLNKNELSEEVLKSHNAALLLAYKYHTILSVEVDKSIEEARSNSKTLKSSIELIDTLIDQNKSLLDNDKAIAKAYFSLKKEAKKLGDEQKIKSMVSSTNAKKSNPTPPNTVEYFYTCAEMIIELDTGNRLYLKDVSELARNELLDKVADYKLEWKKEDPFKIEWFHKQLKKHPNLPEYLRSKKGKNEALRKEAINNIKILRGL